MPVAKLSVAAQLSMDKKHTAADSQYREPQDQIILEPALLGAFLDDVLHAQQENGHTEQAQPVEPLGQTAVALVEVAVAAHQKQRKQAGADIDEEQPAPIEPLGEVPAESWPDRGSQGDDHARHHIGCDPSFRREGCESGRKHRRDHGAANEPLQPAGNNQHVHRGGKPCNDTHDQKAKAGGQINLLGPPDPRQEGRQRNHHHFGDQIGALNPADLVIAGADAGLNLRQGRRNDLDIQNRHELPKGHAPKSQEQGDPVDCCGRFGRFCLCHGLVTRPAFGHDGRPIACFRQRRSTLDQNIHLDFNGQSRTQSPAFFTGLQSNPHRKALRNLGEVAHCIFNGNEREFGPCCRCKTFDMSANDPVREGVSPDQHRLPQS